MPKLGMEEIRKEQIINAAKDQIVHYGLSNLSLKDIAQEAGVSTGVIYHYFTNKEDVLLNVLKESFKKSHMAVVEALEHMPSAEEKLLKHMEVINAVPKENPEFYLLLMDYLGEANHNEEIRKIIQKFFRNLTVYIKEYLENDEDKEMGNLPVMIYALGMGLGLMWTIDKDLYDISGMENDMKKMIAGFLERKGD